LEGLCRYSLRLGTEQVEKKALQFFL
jgi:hypothetical protein